MSAPRRKVQLGGDLAAGHWREIPGFPGRYLVRPSGPKEFRAIRVAAGLPAYEPNGERLTDEQQEKLHACTVDHVIEAWEDVLDGEGPAPCTLQWKASLLGAVPGLLGALLIVSKEVARERVYEEASDQGNS